jgi:hypothetical protein
MLINETLEQILSVLIEIHNSMNANDPVSLFTEYDQPAFDGNHALCGFDELEKEMNDEQIDRQHELQGLANLFFIALVQADLSGPEGQLRSNWVKNTLIKLTEYLDE